MGIDVVGEVLAEAAEGDVDPEEAHLREPLLDPADAKARAAGAQIMSGG